MKNEPDSNPFMDHKLGRSEPEPELSLIIRRIAEIRDELRSRGVDPLVKEEGNLKDRLKALLMKRGLEAAYDETSNWEAVMVPRSSDAWDVGALKKALTAKQRGRYIAESVNSEAVKAGLENGDLSRAELEKTGAVKRVGKSVALYVRERKQSDGDDEDD